MHVRPFRGAGFVVSAVVTLSGAATIGAQRPAFKSGVDLVPLTVTVTDPKGKYVTGLCGSDFQDRPEDPECMRHPISNEGRENFS